MREFSRAVVVFTLLPMIMIMGALEAVIRGYLTSINVSLRNK